MIPEPLIDFSLEAFPKTSMSAMVYQQEFGCLSSVCCGFAFIYTDGSKDDISVGWSLISSDHLFGAQLPGLAIVSMAELTAIREALELIMAVTPSNF